MWEFWETTARSRDHYFHGTVVQWLFEDLAGLRCGDHGWSEFEVRPQPLADLRYASYAIETVRGRAGVSWTRSDDRFALTVEVPDGAEATVIMPGRESEKITEFTATLG
jgi:alpha-L-rhamnosidase